MTEPGQLQGIDTIILRVADINRSVQWYVEKLEFKVVWNDPSMKLAVLDPGGAVSITLWETAKKSVVDRDSAAYPIFRTSDAAAARQWLLERGVAAGELVSDSSVRYFHFEDPDGNLLEACQVMDA